MAGQGRDIETIFGLRRPWWAAIAATPVIFTVFQTSTVFDVTLNVAEDALIAGKYTGQWITGAFVVGMMAGIFLTATLRGLVGMRNVYAIGLTFFILGSALDSVAPGVTWMTCSKFISGFGRGLVISNLRATIYNHFPDELLYAFAFYGIVGYSSRLLSPLYAAYVVDWANWRWIHINDVWLGILGLIMTFYFLRNDRPKVISKIHFDGVGYVLWIATVVAILVLFDRSQLWGYMSSNNFAIAMASFLVLAIATVVWCTIHPDPIFDFRAIPPIRSFALAMVTKSCFIASLYAVAGGISTYMVDLRGYPRTTSGWILWPGGLGMIVAMGLSATVLPELLSRRRRLMLGMFATALVTWQFSTVDLYTDKFWIAAMMGLWGLALGSTVLPILAYAQEGLNPKVGLKAVAIGMTIYVLPIDLVSGTNRILHERATDYYQQRLSLDDIPNRPIVEITEERVADHVATRGATTSNVNETSVAILKTWLKMNAAALGYQWLFWVVGFVPLVGVFFAALLPEQKVKYLELLRKARLDKPMPAH
ncbi:Multidrug resistance protein stp [Planctomycetes bacterium Pan216]|uniref:Multidrug resistance protein stp n=1 Tax=Kolteria novifilia TaxID=2527975 RepID=A0A518B5N8_9BACT|nr:Multidrug resistance protein stp [Planctomycetes bacterium Pan216]